MNLVDAVHLPSVNAVLNLSSAVCLFFGYRFIKQGNIPAHKRAMLAAFTISTTFLVSYLYYHYHAGSTRFTGQGPIRFIYFAILLSHTLLAMAVAPMAITSLSRGLRNKVDDHKRIARWTFPVWIYVSVTGVIIYLMLYQL